ncbi:phosphoglycerate kinase [Convivina intestini]|uniref:Phosphoglycerate kinase n=1 Tax=Convivina intestini TaxID=1505726 RepID=A0A2U1D7Y0_9LACO|nr:phosphoglycerate kinase [Convivina intestini]PVY83784.1 phosphoglycerate kinase [Convivina intestini]CAH1853507.1 Phosphoglycerate kinase [Convivina intestini]CAH1854777.1 Phosphoglycerate kinase [Convivina intestini]SDB93134.1 phosphoglycerate kinase [Leuconostocaceae bacterium R-53105]
MAKLAVTDLELAGKKVLMRVDFNVPIKGGVIGNDNRIVAALPTIKYVLEHNGRAILFSHLGRIKTEDDKKELSLAPVAKHLGELLGKDVTFIPETRGAELEAAVNALEDGQILMVENTRFEDVKDGEYVKLESGNDPELGKYWASLGDDIFINDAFGTAHRAHASNVGIASNVDQAAAGFLMEKEIKYLGETVANPKRPFVAIIGGAKVSDKIEVIKALLNKADKVIVGGGMAYTFDAAKGNKIGNSLFEADKVELAKQLMAEAGDKLVLPVDAVAADAFNNDAKTVIVDSAAGIPDGYMGLDIGPKSIALFQEVLSDAKTVVWNGPMGVFEMPNFAKGTLAIGNELVKVTENGGATIVGGGDSTAAVQALGVADKLSHISTGGGASLEYLEGKPLPGIESLTNK